MAKTAGTIKLRRPRTTTDLSFYEFWVECHGEDEEAWYGYELGGSSEHYRSFRKETYEILEDSRAEVPA